METDSNGRLWLKNRLSIDTYGANNLVGIGKLDNEQTKDPIHGGRVMDANGDFVVYEDGHIQAKSGQIGAMSIDSIERSAIKVEITSSVGNSMKMGTSTLLTAWVYRGEKKVSN
jgi:hypothetical protein